MSKPLLMKNIAINPEDYTILAVDDIATNIMLLKAVLSRAKYKIVTASGGNEALEKAAACHFVFEIGIGDENRTMGY